MRLPSEPDYRSFRVCHRLWTCRNPSCPYPEKACQPLSISKQPRFRLAYDDPKAHEGSGMGQPCARHKWRTLSFVIQIDHYNPGTESGRIVVPIDHPPQILLSDSTIYTIEFSAYMLNKTKEYRFVNESLNCSRDRHAIRHAQDL
jgi:hypothetical protein